MRYRVAGLLMAVVLASGCGDAALPEEVGDVGTTQPGDRTSQPGDGTSPAATGGDAGAEDGLVDEPVVSEDNEIERPGVSLVPVTGGARIGGATGSSDTAPGQGPVPAGLESMVVEAVADLAERLGMDPDLVDVIGAEFVVWPDGGLGCPQPGMRYTQVQVDGVRIVLGDGDRTYAYHAGGGRGPFLCDPAKDVGTQP